MKKLLLLLVLLVLPACTINYSHQAKAHPDFERDMYDCERDAAPVQDRARNWQMIERCMRVKGWHHNYKWVAFF